jgi:hypothetical protein
VRKEDNTAQKKMNPFKPIIFLATEAFIHGISLERPGK